MLPGVSKVMFPKVGVFAGHGKKKKKWQQQEDTEEAAAPQVPAGPKKEVPKPYMADAKYVTSEFRTTGNTLLHVTD